MRTLDLTDPSIFVQPFAKAFDADDYAQALQLVDNLLAAYPGNTELYWYRGCCLVQLGEQDKLLAEINARLQKLEYENEDDEAVHEDEDGNQPEQPQLPDEQLFARTLAGMPGNVCERLNCLGVTTNPQKTLAFYSHRIELAPDNAELYAQRGDQYYHVMAMLWPDEDGQYPDNGRPTVRTALGMVYDQTILEAALADFQRAAQLSEPSSREWRHHLRRSADILHLLQRYDEALTTYDQILAQLSADDPSREFLVELRHKSENQGQGEFDQMADMIAQVGRNMQGKGNRTAQGDMEYAMMRTLEQAVRSGQSAGDAADAYLSDSPDDLMALNIAHQIMDAAHEPPPELVEVELKSYPAFQRRHIRTIDKQFTALGYLHLGHFEAPNLTERIGQAVALSIHLHPRGLTGGGVFAMKPKWPGWLGCALMMLSGQWRKQRAVELTTQTDNGYFANTRWQIPDFLGNGPRVQMTELPKNTPVKKLIHAHERAIKKMLAANPCKLVTLDSLTRIEQAWALAAQLKKEYRRSINYVTDEELRKLLGKNHGRFAAKVRNKIAQLTPLYETD